MLLALSCGRRDHDAASTDPSAADDTGDGSADATVGDDADDDDASGSAEDAGDDADETGPDVPDLPGDCTPATFTCAEDGYAQLACGWDPETETTDWGWRIPCGDGENCAGGACSGGACRSPELLYVVDRSDSMLEGGRWDWVAATLTDFGAEFGTTAQQGVRMFPDGPCEPGGIDPIETRPNGFGSLLTPPTTGASTPIHAALDDLAPAFGDPDQSQAVILVTDGDETCDPGSSPSLAASNLFRLGIRVYAIGVSTQANLPLLDEIATLGGTVTARRVSDAASLRNVLDSILEDLDACPCAPGTTWCTDGVSSTCSADGSGVESEVPCASGTCADGSSCEGLTCYQLCDQLGEADLPALQCLADAVHMFANTELCADIDPIDLGGAHCLECFEGLACNMLAELCF